MIKIDKKSIQQEILSYLQTYKKDYMFKNNKNIFLGNINYNKDLQIWVLGNKKPYIKLAHKSNYNGIFFKKNAYIILEKKNVIEYNSIVTEYSLIFIYQKNSTARIKFSSAYFTTQIMEAINIENTNKKKTIEIYRYVMDDNYYFHDNKLKNIFSNLIELEGDDSNF